MLPNPAVGSLSPVVALASASQAQRRPSSKVRERREGGRGKTTKFKAEPYSSVPPSLSPHSSRGTLPAPPAPPLPGLVTATDTGWLPRGEPPREATIPCPCQRPGAHVPLWNRRRAQAGSRLQLRSGTSARGLGTRAKSAT